MGQYADRYHHCPELQDALNELFGEGKRRAGTAGELKGARAVREALLDAAKKIRKHLENTITTDYRLLATAAGTLDRLEKELGDLKEDSNNELEIISQLLSLVVRLLGYDWKMGHPNRHIIYYQTKEQRALDQERRQADASQSGKLEQEKRLELITLLYDQGLDVDQIAGVMKQSAPIVKEFLLRAGRIRTK